MNMSDYSEPFPSQNLTLSQQGAEVAAVIGTVLSANPGKSKVIFVCHSMGGLAVRSYLQGLAQRNDGSRIPYGDDVFKLITVDTPHQGAELATVIRESTPAAFAVRKALNLKADSVGAGELVPNSSSLLALNNLLANPLPKTVSYVSIVGVGVNVLLFPGLDGDGIVSSFSQRMGNILGVSELPHVSREFFIVPRTDCDPIYGLNNDVRLALGLSPTEDGFVSHTCATTDTGVRSEILNQLAPAPDLPAVNTVPADAGNTFAVLHGRILNTGGSAIIDRRFEWGSTAAPDSKTWTASNLTPLPITVSGDEFSATLTGLLPNHTYYYRSWARNGSSQVAPGTSQAGWGFGSILSFTTSASNPGQVVTPTISPNGGSYNGSVVVRLACSTPSATIHYTTDRTDPTATSPLYAGAFSLTISTVVKARGFAPGYTDSSIASAEFTISSSSTVATPTIKPNGGSYDDFVQVTIECSTPGAAIYYTMDGSIPLKGEPGQLYTGSFGLTASKTLKAKAFLPGYKDSAVAEANFIIMKNGQPNDLFENRLTLTGLSGSIKGTTLGARDSDDDPLIGEVIPWNSVWFTWTAPAAGQGHFVPTWDRNTTRSVLVGVYSGSELRSLSLVAGSSPTGDPIVRVGAVAGTTYQIQVGDQYLGVHGEFTLFWEFNPDPVPPSIITHPQSQSAKPGQAVEFLVVADGTEPLTYQWRFNGVEIPGATEATLTLNDVGIGDAGDYSVTVTNLAGLVVSDGTELTIDIPKIAKPTILTAGDPVNGPVQVTINCETIDAEIHYTLDRSEPTLRSPKYESPFNLSVSATVTARAFSSGMIESDIVSASVGIGVPTGIAFAGGTNGYHNTGGTTHTIPFTVSGSNTLLVVGWGHDGSQAARDITVTSATYNGRPMISIGSRNFSPRNREGHFNMGMFYLLNPDVGTHDLVLTRDIASSTMDYTVGLYTGVNQVEQPEAISIDISPTPTASQPTTIMVTSPGSWVIGSVFGDSSIAAAGDNLVMRQQSPDQNTLFDSGQEMRMGDYALAWTFTEPANSGWVFASFAPANYELPAPQIRSVEGPDKSEFEIQIQTSPNTPLKIQTSVDLVFWTDAITTSADSQGVGHFAGRTDSNQRLFYRAVLLNTP